MTERPPPSSPATRRQVIWLVVAVLLAAVVVLSIPPESSRGPVSNDAFARGSLETIEVAQTLFRERDAERDGTLDYGTLQELSDATFVDHVLGAGVKQGYRFDARPSPATPEFLWFAVANPVQPGVSGERYFCTNHAGVIHYTTARAIAITEGGPDCAIPAGLVRLGGP